MTISKGPQAFPRTEYLRRLAAVKSEMTQLDIDALVVNNSSNITYLTGYTARSGDVPQGLLVSNQREEPIFILCRPDAPAAIYQSFLERQNVISYRENLVDNSDADGFDAVIDLLHEFGLGNRSLGLELGHLSAQNGEKFRARLPKARIVDCTETVARIRIVKSDLEICIMREAAAIADAGIMRATEVIRRGVRESEAMAEIAATLARGANGKPGTDLAPMSFCSSPRIGTPHIVWSESIIQDGSQIKLELGGVRHGYVAAIRRTFSVGAPSDRLRRLHEAELSGLEVTLNSVRPGVTCGEVADASCHTIENLGFKTDSALGYAIGIDWTEPTASLKRGDMTELKQNMTFHLMLGNWIGEDFGYAISETFRVTEFGVEVLTCAPRMLFEL